MTRYFLFAGEVSGDLHGSRLMQAFQAQDHSVSLSGVGGPRMRANGLACLLQMEEFQVMGFSDVFKALPRLWRLFQRVRDAILEAQPDCVVLIDYPGFNLRLAKALRKRNFKGKIVQYICPTVWAHGRKRIQTLADHFDLVLTIYPFEAAYFAHTSLPIKYVGNPLTDTIRSHNYQPDWAAQIGLSLDTELIALFPGSRQGEVKRHLPQQIHAAALLKQRYPPVKFALSCAQESLKATLLELLQNTPLRLNEDLYVVPPCHHYELMRACHTAIAKSGTVTLELALHGVPTVVHYELSSTNYLFAKYVLGLTLPHYCIVNILRQQTVFPELIGQKVLPSTLYEQAAFLYSDTDRRAQIVANCHSLKQQLGDQSSHQFAARAIEELVGC
jgi:lipid-A-disaccharide synthase